MGGRVVEGAQCVRLRCIMFCSEIEAQESGEVGEYREGVVASDGIRRDDEQVSM